ARVGPALVAFEGDRDHGLAGVGRVVLDEGLGLESEDGVARGVGNGRVVGGPGDVVVLAVAVMSGVIAARVEAKTVDSSSPRGDLTLHEAPVPEVAGRGSAVPVGPPVSARQPGLAARGDVLEIAARAVVIVRR